MDEFRAHISANKPLYGSLLLVLAIVAVWGVAREAGWSLLSRGILSIEFVGAGAVIFVDEKEVERVEEGESRLAIDLSPGNHTVLVTREGFWPWTKEVVVEKDDEVSVAPFLAPAGARATLIRRTDSEYRDVSSLFSETTYPTEAAPRISTSGDVEIWVAENVLVAHWIGPEETIPEEFCIDDGCTGQISIIQPQAEIRNVDYWDDTDDVVIFASGDGVFVIESDKRGTQNFQPLYQGTAPDFRLGENRELYIQDEGQFLMIEL